VVSVLPFIFKACTGAVSSAAARSALPLWGNVAPADAFGACVAPASSLAEWPFAGFKWVQSMNHATAQMNYTLAHQAAFHQHSIGGSPIELSTETLSRVHTQTSGARGSKGPLCLSPRSPPSSTFCRQWESPSSPSSHRNPPHFFSHHFVFVASGTTLV